MTFAARWPRLRSVGVVMGRVMKTILSAVVLALALSQVAQAETKVPVKPAKVVKTQKTRPPLDQTATGGIVASGGVTPAVDPSKIYPPALYLNF